MPAHLDWFTTRIDDDGAQIIHIRPSETKKAEDTLYLDKEQSQLLTHILDRIVLDRNIPWTETRQAVLWGFVKALKPEIDRASERPAQDRTNDTKAPR